MFYQILPVLHIYLAGSGFGCPSLFSTLRGWTSRPGTRGFSISRHSDVIVSRVLAPASTQTSPPAEFLRQSALGYRRQPSPGASWHADIITSRVLTPVGALISPYFGTSQRAYSGSTSKARGLNHSDETSRLTARVQKEPKRHLDAVTFCPCAYFPVLCLLGTTRITTREHGIPIG